MTTKIYVGNLPRELTRNELLEHFTNVCDEILKIDLGIDREGCFNGYCYLTVDNSAVADEICDKYHHSKLFGVQLRVTKCLQRHHHEYEAAEASYCLSV